MYENLENSGYPVSPETGGLTQLGNNSSSDMETIENKWSQFMSHDTSFNFPPQSQYGTISYPPSKVKFKLYISKKYKIKIGEYVTFCFQTNLLSIEFSSYNRLI